MKIRKFALATQKWPLKLLGEVATGENQSKRWPLRVVATLLSKVVRSRRGEGLASVRPVLSALSRAATVLRSPKCTFTRGHVQTQLNGKAARSGLSRLNQIQFKKALNIRLERSSVI